MRRVSRVWPECYDTLIMVVLCENVCLDQCEANEITAHELEKSSAMNLQQCPDTGLDSLYLH